MTAIAPEMTSDEEAAYSNWRREATREELMRYLDSLESELAGYRDLRNRAFKWCHGNSMVEDAGATTTLHDEKPSEYGPNVALLTERGVPTLASLEIALEVAIATTQRFWDANPGFPIQFGQPDRLYELRRINQL